ncbi:serine hydrolase domain-containing protein [Myxococcus sp. RHSTA-1-4]|uniref:serine hydrolase domain-containing protein n=1 Tax=Myxococcus sp. RHSTA-1-4 TaxID=2874601 RepID=UPI001CC00734|nr:serine hydrolase domain-containing protein [Myxococcus sp. RHSTA-1-4]MBZ4420853.1 serine hydrolase [Myxococcus sp. RHSTA-1-4]
MKWLNARAAGVLLVFALAVPAAEAASRQQELDRLVAKYHQLRQFNGAVLVAGEKGIIFKKGYGQANLEWQVPNTTDTKFRIASVTKPFTATVVMQLVAEGKLKLDDTLTTHLPDYRKDTGSRVTIAHLLNHTSGIPSYTTPEFFQRESRNPYPVAEFVKKFASGDLEFEPGTKWAYSNSGYHLLGAIIEKVTGMPYAEAVRQRIFAPLGMKNSGYDVTMAVLPKRASGYQLGPDGYVNAPYLDMSIPYASGSLYSTVEDLYLWDRALYTDTLLPAPLKQRMFTPGLSQYGYGWEVRPFKLDDGKTEVSTTLHDGGINGFSSLLVRAPERKELVVLLDNTSRGDKLDALARGLLSILHGIKPQQPRKPVAEAVLEALDKAPVAEGIARYKALKATKAAEYDFSEGQLNGVGYRLLMSGRALDAIEIFKLNVEMFPNSGNPHDSLGEAYLVSGNKEQALVNYRRALELDPSNVNAAETVKRLEKAGGAAK